MSPRAYCTRSRSVRSRAEFRTATVIGDGPGWQSVRAHRRRRGRARSGAGPRRRCRSGSRCNRRGGRRRCPCRGCS